MPEEIPITHYVYEMGKTMKDTSERLERKLDANTELTEKVLLQATKTNGRVTALEKVTEDLPQMKSRMSWIVGVGAATVILIGVIYALLLKNITTTISLKFNQCCSDIQKKTENASNISNTVNVK